MGERARKRRSKAAERGNENNASARSAPREATLEQESSKSSIFETWAELASHVLRAESNLAGALLRHPTRVGDAREAFVNKLLLQVIPSAYEIGKGQVIDARQKLSRQIDIIIARRDMPALRFPDGSAHYLIESVLATIEVKSQLGPEELYLALDNCRSVGDLEMSFHPPSLVRTVKQNGYEITSSGEVFRRNPNGTTSAPPHAVMEKLKTAGRPETYIFGFSGYKANLDDFKEAIRRWARDRHTQLELKHLPTVIATEGCLALRNQYGAGVMHDGSWPLVFVRKEENTLGYLVRQLLYHIQRAMPPLENADGLQPTIERYLSMGIPQTAEGIMMVTGTRRWPSGEG